MTAGIERIKTELEYGETYRRVPQKPISASEIVSYAVLPFILIMCGAMPSAALFFLPVALAFLYVLYRRFGIYLPIACIAVYGAVALGINYDILTVVYLFGLFFALFGLIVGAQQTHYLAYAACAAVFAIFGALFGAGVVRLAEDKPVTEIASDYVLRESDDPFLRFLAREYYADLSLPPDETKLEPSDPEYAQAATIGFARYMSDELEKYLLYYCIHYGAVTAAVGFFVSVVVNRNTASAYDIGVTPEMLASSTRALGGVGNMTTPISAMKMPRSYLWTCVLPATVAGIVLELIGGLDPLSATVMHTFATLPSAFGCFTLIAFFASLFKGKAKTVANAVVCVVGAAAVTFPIALFAMSVVGVCDCILNIRFWVKFIAED